MTSSLPTTETDSTLPACPTWCNCAGRHSDDDDTDGLGRWHWQSIGGVRSSGVAVVAEETPWGIRPPLVVLDGDEYTGPEARRLAALLLEAADRRDQIDVELVPGIEEEND